jgi:iron complex transport system ATP-binding protein
MSAIGLDGVTVRLGGRAVVRDVTATVERGEWVALIGPNGAGKTTLLRAVAGLLPHEGSVSLLGKDAARLDRRERARLLAVVPQTPETPPWLTVAEYVLMGRTPHLGPLAREGADDRHAAARALARLDLEPFAERRLGTLSGGERQRVVVARALAQEASIVLLDEPTAALDIGHQQQALELLDALRAADGLTLVAAMHDLTVAALYADRVLLLSAGAIVADGVPADVLTEEALATHYGASVRVVTVDDRFAVLPTRG